MKFDSRDIEAVAKRRVSDREGKIGNIWNFGVMIGLVVGWVIRMQRFINSEMWGWAIISISILALAYFWFYQLPKKQKIYISQLWLEYQKEQEAK